MSKYIKSFIVTFIGLIISAGCSTTVSVHPDANISPDKTIAVIDIGHIPKWKLTDFFVLGALVDLPLNAAPAIEERLLFSGMCRIADRSQINKILQEKRLSETELVNTGNAIEVGKLAGVNAIMTVESKAKTIFACGFALDIAEANVRVIDVHSGTVIAAMRGKRRYPWFLCGYWFLMDPDEGLAESFVDKFEQQLKPE